MSGQLQLFVNLEVERQLLRGGTNTSEVVGLLNGRGVPVYSAGTVAGNKAFQIFRAMNSMRGGALIEPEWVLMNPSDYEQIRLLTDSQGQLFGGGPFFGPYSNPTQVGASGQITGATDSLWGKPTSVSASAGVGTAVIGTKSNGLVYSRGGLRVEASNSASVSGVDFWSHNLVSVRAERRWGL